MNKYIFAFVFLFLCSATLAQDDFEKPQNRIVVGGGLGLQFGTITMIDISPTIGYKVTERFMPGIGINYQYYKDTRFEPDYETNIIGGSVFARYYLWENLFAHAEYQRLGYDQLLYPSKEKERVTVDSYLIGGGYRQWIGGNFAATIVVLFNLNESIDSPYSNPIFRLGFQTGF